MAYTLKELSELKLTPPREERLAQQWEMERTEDADYEALADLMQWTLPRVAGDLVTTSHGTRLSE